MSVGLKNLLEVILVYYEVNILVLRNKKRTTNSFIPIKNSIASSQTLLRFTMLENNLLNKRFLSFQLNSISQI
jgi:hypothetical protein